MKSVELLSIFDTKFLGFSNCFCNNSSYSSNATSCSPSWIFLVLYRILSAKVRARPSTSRYGIRQWQSRWRISSVLLELLLSAFTFLVWSEITSYSWNEMTRYLLASRSRGSCCNNLQSDYEKSMPPLLRIEEEKKIA